MKPGKVAALVALAAMFGTIATVQATVTSTGDVDPPLATSTSTTTVYIASVADGSVTVNGGSTVASDTAYLGFNAGFTGSALVTGPGSTWNTYLYVGFDGNGVLQITNGGKVIGGSGYVGDGTGSIGSVIVDGPGSSWTGMDGGLYVGDYGTGSVQILHGAVVSSGSGYIGGYSGSTDTVTMDGSGSSWTGMSGGIYVGYNGPGALYIRNGAKLSSDTGYIGFREAPGLIVVDGAGSSWTENRGGIYVDNGTLKVTRGATVTSDFGYLEGPAAIVSIDGVGSTWTSANEIDLDPSAGDTATLKITGGGKVRAPVFYIDSADGLVEMTIGDGSKLDLGTGSLTNHGTIRLAAVPGLTAGSTWSPITASPASTWGTVQPLGGTWSNATRLFTVSAEVTGTGGTPVSIDLAQKQIVCITDPATGEEVSASFAPAATPTNVNFTATPLTPGEMATLTGTLPDNEIPTCGWTFSAPGYTPGDPVYLSMDVGPGFSESDLGVWHYDGSAWTPYAVNDLTYDGNVASFTVTGFSGYAVTAVPEPATIVLLALGACVAARRRKHA